MQYEIFCFKDFGQSDIYMQKSLMTELYILLEDVRYTNLFTKIFTNY